MRTMKSVIPGSTTDKVLRLLQSRGPMREPDIRKALGLGRRMCAFLIWMRDRELLDCETVLPKGHTRPTRMWSARTNYSTAYALDQRLSQVLYLVDAIGMVTVNDVVSYLGVTKFLAIKYIALLAASGLVKQSRGWENGRLVKFSQRLDTQYAAPSRNQEPSTGEVKTRPPAPVSHGALLDFVVSQLGHLPEPLCGD